MSEFKFNDVEQTQECNTINEMRTEFLRMRRHSPIVSNSLNTADYQGFNAEDRFAFLAYNLLKSHQELHARLLYVESIMMPLPKLTIKT